MLIIYIFLVFVLSEDYVEIIVEILEKILKMVCFYVMINFMGEDVVYVVWKVCVNNVILIYCIFEGVVGVFMYLVSYCCN